MFSNRFFSHFLTKKKEYENRLIDVKSLFHAYINHVRSLAALRGTIKVVFLYGV